MKNQTLVIVPGWGGSHETWEKFMVAARPYFQDVVCIDLPCFGGNACPKTVWGVEQYAEYVKLKINKIKEKTESEIILMGHSFGGQVSAYLVANSPHICDKYILNAGAVFRPSRPIRRVFFWLLAKTGKLVFKIPMIEHAGVWAKKMLYKSADSPDYSKTSGIQTEIYKKIIRQDLTTELPKISIPTLIVWGTLDKYLPLKDGINAQKLIKDSKIEIISGGTHGLHLFKTEELLQKVKDFVQ